MSELPDSQTPALPPSADYDDRYLAGILCFNRGEYFDAHEVWEALWMDCPSADRRFFQSLIQAAVTLYHWGRGNRPGSERLFLSGRKYMEPFRPKYHGLDVASFWTDVEAAMTPSGNRPRIVLDAAPNEIHHE